MNQVTQSVETQEARLSRFVLCSCTRSLQFKRRRWQRITAAIARWLHYRSFPDQGCFRFKICPIETLHRSIEPDAAVIDLETGLNPHVGVENVKMPLRSLIYSDDWI